MIIKKIKYFIEWMNRKGIPVPLARVDEKPSVSFTLLILSAAFVMLGLIDSVVHFGISFWEALSWHALSAVLYYNRSAKISKDGIELDGDDKDAKNNKK